MRPGNTYRVARRNRSKGLMNIYWKKLGGHIHMRLFMNGAKIGDLCVRESEWDIFRKRVLANYEEESATI